MTTTIHRHLQATPRFVIEAIEDAKRQGKPQDYVTRDGQPISHGDALAHLRQMIADGYEVIPCCENVDDAGRCLGS